MPEFKKLPLKTISGRGCNLTAIECLDLVPFDVKRVYYLTKFQAGAQTGEHCHKIEEEVFVQMQGSSIAIIDKGQGKEEIFLNGPSDAIYVPNYVWHGFKNASPDCVIMALSSTRYNPTREDYVENYNEYLEFRDEKLR